MDLNDAIELVKRKRRRSRPMKELLRHIVNSWEYIYLYHKIRFISSIKNYYNI